METNNVTTDRPQKIKKPILKNFAIAAAALTVILLAGFTVRVFMFYRLIQKGEYAALPQFSSRLTLGKGIKIQQDLPTELEGTDDPTIGNKKSPVTIVEFADFQCRYSRDAFSAVREMTAKYGDQIRFIYRDFPLEEAHPNARKAAIAAHCAGAQNKFWQMHDKIYLSSDALGETDLIRYAQEIGLNAALFSSCLASPSQSAEIDKDLADGVALGVQGTPTFFFNGRKIEGAIPKEIFDQIIKEMLSQ